MMRSLTPGKCSFLYLFLLCLLPLGTVLAQVPHIEPADECHVTPDPAFQNDIECGWMVVPEQRDNYKGGGPTVRLAYAIARAEAKDPEPDPIIFIRGGPGLSNLAIMNRELGQSPWKELRKRRDLIFVDVRGTGYSEPAICPSLNDVWRETDYLFVRDEEFNLKLAQAAALCADSMAASGRNIGAYNASTVASDLEDLRRLLGYERWNVYGWSYGGRYAQMLMNQHPEAIRSVVLSAPAPMGSAPISRTVALKEALDLVFLQCREDVACNTAYPDLERQFITLMERLETDPVRFDVPASTGLPGRELVINRRVALWHIQMELYGSQLAPVLPLLISEAARGNNEALLAFLPSEQGRWGSDPYSEGLALTTICHDDAGKPDTAQDDSVRLTHPHLSFRGWYWARLEVCDSVHQMRASEQERTPPDAPIPTLILAGGHDPTVAESTVHYTAQALADTQLAIAPALGHVAANTNSCLSGLTAAFYDAPHSAVDTTCLSDYDSIQFVTDIRRLQGSARFNTWLTGILSGSLRGGAPPDGSMAHAIWVQVSLLGLLSALLIWPVVWLVRRFRRSAGKRLPEEKLAMLLAGVTCLVGISVVPLIGYAIQLTVETNYRILAVGVVEEMGWVFVLPWVWTVLTLMLVMVTIIAWRRAYWGRWMRVHFSVVALAAVSLTLFMGYWGLY